MMSNYGAHKESIAIKIKERKKQPHSLFKISSLERLNTATGYKTTGYNRCDYYKS